MGINYNQPMDPDDSRCTYCGKRCHSRTQRNRCEDECRRIEQERRDDLLADRLSEELLR